METKHLTKTNGGNIAVLVSYAFNGEYVLPSGYQKKSEIFDSNTAEEILECAMDLDYPEIKEPLNKALRGILGSHIKGYYHPNHSWDLETIEAQEQGTVFMLEFKDEKQLKAYLKIFEAEAAEVARTAGGDDSFFDYMPGFIDIFAQLCQITKAEERYAKFIQKLIKTNPHEIDYEFYRETI